LTSTIEPVASKAISFGITPREQAWIDKVREMSATFAERAAEHDESGQLPIENLRTLHAEGIDVLFFPAALGGEAISHQAFGEILRTISEADPATACVWLMHVGAALGLAQRTTESLGTFYADELHAGKRFANALTEPAGGGSRFLFPQQEAVPVAGGYRIDGAKRFVSGCEIADHFLVNVLVDGEPTFFGVAANPTIEFTPIWDTLGLRASRSQLVSFSGTLLTNEHRLRPQQPGDLEAISIGLAPLSLGIADAALKALIAHARKRIVVNTGLPLAHMQWVQFAVAEKQSALEAARAYVMQMLWQLDNGIFDLAAIIRAKLLANEVAREVAQLGVSVGGASGFLRSSSIQRHFRDAQAGGLMAYSIETSKAFIGADLLGINGESSR